MVVMGVTLPPARHGSVKTPSSRWSGRLRFARPAAAGYACRVLRVRLLGELQADLDGLPVTPPASRRAWGLLAWLALHPGEHARGSVAAHFWPDVLDSSARASLRSALWELRRVLGAGEALEAGRDRVALV